MERNGYVAEEGPEENYMTMKDPTGEDWLRYITPLVDESVAEIPEDQEVPPLVHVDLHAEQEGVSVDEYVDEMHDRIKKVSMSRVGLRLCHGEMDDSWHALPVWLKKGEGRGRQ